MSRLPDVGAAGPIADLVLAGLTRPADRSELNAVLAIEAMRIELQMLRHPISIERVRRSPSDTSRFPEAARAATQESVGSWIQLSAVHRNFGRVLYRVARSIGGPVLEFGTGAAISAAYLGAGLAADAGARGQLVSVDSDAALVELARETLGKLKIPRFTLAVAEQNREGPALVRDLQPTVVHIDSDHRRARLVQLLETIQRSIDRPTTVCLDDIRWSDGMEETWEEIRAGRFGSVASVDLGLWGLAVLSPVRPGWTQRISAIAPIGMSGVEVVEQDRVAVPVAWA